MATKAGPNIITDGLVLNIDPANVKSYDFYTDPYASNVSLYLKMDGVNGGTTFTDSSPNGVIVTRGGNAQISTTKSKYNLTSAYFDGVGDYLSFPTSENFNFGSGDFTVEFWYYYNGLPQAAARLFQTRNGDLYAGLSITHKFTNRGVDLTFAASTNGSTWTYNNGEAGSFSVTANAWTHVAVVRSGTVLYCYINGVQNTIFASFVGSLYYNAADTCVIGGQAGTSRSINGYIDNLKITKAIARYTSTFTSPPIPSKITDLTKNKNIATLTNGVDYNFSNGGVINLSGTNQYLAVNGGMPSGISTEFTFECWIRVADLANYRAITRTNGGLDIGIVATTGAVTCDRTGIANICVTPSGAVVAGTWANITVTRTTSNLYTIYVNGVSRASGTNAFTVTGATTIGYSSFSASHYFKGDIAIIKNYNRLLSSNEILQNFNATKSRYGL